jgi:hypothetical protein
LLEMDEDARGIVRELVDLKPFPPHDHPNLKE